MKHSMFNWEHEDSETEESDESDIVSVSKGMYVQMQNLTSAELQVLHDVIAGAWLGLRNESPVEVRQCLDYTDQLQAY